MKQHMNFKQLYLRLASFEDINILYDWANDPITRMNSFNSTQIPYETHVKWFHKMMLDEDVLQFILMCDNTPVGQARLSINGSDAEIGYSIDSKYRGMGYGKMLCQLLIDKVREEYPQIKNLIAQVKPQNVASLYCFQKCGFIKSFEQYELEIDMEKESCK